jgi:hypothetical protein
MRVANRGRFEYRLMERKLGFAAEIVEQDRQQRLWASLIPVGIGPVVGCWVVTEQKIHLRTQAASSVGLGRVAEFRRPYAERTKTRRGQR